KSHVRFTPESGHLQCTRPCLLWANSGHKAGAAGALAGRRGAMTTAHTQQQTIASQDRVLVGTLKLFQWRAIMMVTITTFNLAQPTTLDEITKTFQVTAPKYQGVAGLLSKNYWM